MATRVVRSFKYTREFTRLETTVHYFKPEVEYDFEKRGLESTIELGKGDLEKLGYPKRIKVVIYNLD